MKNLLLSALRPFVVLGLLSAALPACRSDAEAVCDMKCDCEGCGRRQLDDCYWKDDNDEREADRKRCLDYWEELQACEYETGTCRPGARWETNCKWERDRWNDCK